MSERELGETLAALDQLMSEEGTEEKRASAEAFFARIFSKLGDIAEQLGVTTSRQVELLQSSQVHRLHQKGRNQQEIMAATGLSLKTVRKVLKTAPLERVGHTDYIAQFIGDWASDPAFPPCLPVRGPEYPDFKDLCDRYGREFTAPALLKILQERGLVDVSESSATLLNRSLTPTTPANMLELGSASVCALVSTLENNFSMNQTPFMERRVRSERIPKERLVIVRKQINELLQEFRQQLILRLTEEESRETGADAEFVTAGVGLFWYEECD